MCQFAPVTKYLCRLFNVETAGNFRPIKGTPADGGRLVTDGGVTTEGGDGEEQIDLDALRAQRSTTPLEKRDYCPICETTKVFRKTGTPDMRERPEAWRCHKGHHFEEPAEYDDLDEEPFGAGVDR